MLAREFSTQNGEGDLWQTEQANFEKIETVTMVRQPDILFLRLIEHELFEIDPIKHTVHKHLHSKRIAHNREIDRTASRNYDLLLIAPYTANVRSHSEFKRAVSR